MSGPISNNNSIDNRFESFKLQGSTDSNTWTDLYTNTTALLLNDSVNNFNVESQNSYLYYRIFVVNATGSNIGLSHWQLYSIDDLL